MCYYIILRAQLYYFACATILVFVRYYISLRALLHLGSVCYYTSVACATILRLRSVRKWKYIMRFEIRYFFLWIGLSPKGLTKSQEKSFKFQTSLYTITFHGLACVTIQCVGYYTMRGLLYNACTTIQCLRYYTCVHHIRACASIL